MIASNYDLAAKIKDSTCLQEQCAIHNDNMNIRCWLLVFQESFNRFNINRTFSRHYTLKKCRLLLGQNRSRHFDRVFFLCRSCTSVLWLLNVFKSRIFPRKYIILARLTTDWQDLILERISMWKSNIFVKTFQRMLIKLIDALHSF